MEIGDFIGYIYKQNFKPTSRYYYAILCNNYAKLSQRVLRTVLITYVCMTFFFVILSLAENYSSGALIPILDAHFPGVDEKTMGFVFVILFNYAMCLIGFYIAGSYNSLLFLIFTNMPMVSSVIVGHLDELRDILEEPKYDIHDVENRLLNIIIMQDIYVK